MIIFILWGLLATVTPQGTGDANGMNVMKLIYLFSGEIISIRFVAINDYGNSFMDNIQIFTNQIVLEKMI